MECAEENTQKGGGRTHRAYTAVSTNLVHLGTEFVHANVCFLLQCQLQRQLRLFSFFLELCILSLQLLQVQRRLTGRLLRFLPVLRKLCTQTTFQLAKCLCLLRFTLSQHQPVTATTMSQSRNAAAHKELWGNELSLFHTPPTAFHSRSFPSAPSPAGASTLSAEPAP